MEKYISDSLAAGFIQPSSSPVELGFFFVGKKDGSMRPCIDYRNPEQHPGKEYLSLAIDVFSFREVAGSICFHKIGFT